MRSHWFLFFSLFSLCGCTRLEQPTPAAARAEASSTALEAPCVYFKELSPFLPAQVPGYRTERDEGSTGKYGEVSVSEAERVFAQGERELAVRIVDTTLSSRLGVTIKAAARGKNSLQVENAVGFIKYDAEEAVAEANLLVAERFVVAVTGRGFGGTAEVSEIAKGFLISRGCQSYAK